MSAPPVPQSVHISFFFFLNDPATTEIYPLPLHDALPIKRRGLGRPPGLGGRSPPSALGHPPPQPQRETAALSSPFSACLRSEEHTSELQSQSNLVCRLLLEKKTTTRHPATVRQHTITSS